MFADGETLNLNSISLPIIGSLLKQKESKFSKLEVSSNIEDVLLRDITFRHFRLSDRVLIRYFIKWSDELVELAFDEDKCRFEISNRAFAIIEHCQIDVTRQIFAGKKMNSIANRIIDGYLMNKCSSNTSLVLNRIVLFIESAICVDPINSLCKCDFILKLLKCTQEPNVLSLLKTACKEASNNNFVAKWLTDMNFFYNLCAEIDLIENEISKFHDKSEILDDSYFNIKAKNEVYYNLTIRLASLFEIIASIDLTLLLGSRSIVMDYLICILNRSVDMYPIYVENPRWEAIASVYCQETCELMQGLFPNAIDLLNDPKNPNKCTMRCGVAALEYLTSVAIIDPIVENYFTEFKVPHLILKLIMEHPEATVFHMTAIRFLDVVFHKETLRSPFIIEFGNILFGTFEEKSPSLRFTFYKILKKLVAAAHKDTKLLNDLKQIDDFIMLLKCNMHNYRLKLHESFGGPINVIQYFDDIQSLTDHANETMGL